MLNYTTMDLAYILKILRENKRPSKQIKEAIQKLEDDICFHVLNMKRTTVQTD